MSDWQVGDLAVCVDASRPTTGLPAVLVVDRVYTISGLYVPQRPERSELGGSAAYGLYLAGITSPARSGSFDPRRFRKIRPDEHEPCEEEFVTLLRRSKPKVRA